LTLTQKQSGTIIFVFDQIFSYVFDCIERLDIPLHDITKPNWWIVGY